MNTDRRNGFGRRLFQWSAGMLAAAACCTLGAEPPADADSEPTVTRAENRLIQDALEMAATNTAQAVVLLRDKNSAQASPVLDYAIGNICLQDGQLEEAVSAYQAALDKDSGFRAATENLGRAYLLQEQPEKAIVLYQDLVVGGSADADLYLLLGHALLMADNVVSAESAYRQALLLRHRDMEARLGLVRTLLRQERFAEGAALLDEMLQQEPVRSDLWMLRAQADMASDRSDHAVRMLETARRLGCADSEMLATLGDLLLDRDQAADAQAAYDEAFRAETPSVDRMLRAAEGFLMMDELEKAGGMLARVEKTKADWPADVAGKRTVSLLHYQAEWARRSGQTKEAQQYCEAALQLDPLDGKMLLTLARLLSEEGHLEEAVMACERAARIKGFEADALVRQAQIEVERGRHARAVELLEAAQVFKDQPYVGRYLEQVRRLAALDTQPDSVSGE